MRHTLVGFAPTRGSRNGVKDVKDVASDCSVQAKSHAFNRARFTKLSKENGSEVSADGLFHTSRFLRLRQLHAFISSCRLGLLARLFAGDAHKA